MTQAQGEPQSIKRGYTVAEAAQYLGVSPAMVRELIRDNKLAARKLGSRLIIDGAELARFFDSLDEA